MTTLAWDGRRDTGYGASFTLALTMHLALLAILFFGVRFASAPPAAVSVELWEPPPPPRVAEPPKPAPKVEPEPPKPEPKVEKPEIVEKALPKPKPKPEPPKAKAEPPKPKAPVRDLEAEKRMREQLAREQSAVNERLAREMAAREAAARELSARERAMAAWIGAIRNKIRGNINLPPDLVGNPEAIFDVSLLPTGEVLTVRMRRSSG